MWIEIPDQTVIDKTAAALTADGMETVVAENKEEAKKKVLELLPDGAEVMNMQSMTLPALGLDREITESGKYKSVRKILNSMDRATQSRQMQVIGSAPEYAVGSVQAVTQNGEVMMVSNTGSQLPAYAYGSDHVIWVIGAQKIVKDLEEGRKRIYEYVLPLESERLKKIYPQITSSNVSKLLIISKEVRPGRVKIILVKEALGF